MAQQLRRSRPSFVGEADEVCSQDAHVDEDLSSRGGIVKRVGRCLWWRARMDAQQAGQTALRSLPPKCDPFFGWKGRDEAASWAAPHTCVSVPRPPRMAVGAISAR